MSIIDGSGSWCPDHAISMEWIERRAAELIENFQDVDSVYMSEDIYHEFELQMKVKMRHSSSLPPSLPPSGPVTFNIATTYGTLLVRQISFFTNFCHVGTETTYDHLTRIKIDQEFEEIVLKDCETE